MDGINATRASTQTAKSGTDYDAVFSDKKDNSIMDPSDFLNLMVTQMQNQDFTNPMDNTQMVTQMAQFSNMQMMQEMASYAKTNYAMSLVGKTVTASRVTVSGDLDTTIGKVDQVSLVDNEYLLYIGDKRYSLEQIMAIGEIEETEIDPAGYKLTAKDITSESATIDWQVPTDDESIGKKLKYTVYYSISKDFDTVQKVESGNKVGLEGNIDITSMEIDGMIPGTTYYANVVVTDANGKKSVYMPVEIVTPE